MGIFYHIWFVCFVYLFCIFISSNVYGHGLGNDQHLIMDDKDGSFTIEGKLYPSFIDDISGSKVTPTLVIRTFNSMNNETVNGIQYNVVIKTGNEIVLNHCFIPKDGIIYAKFFPDFTIKTAEIYSSKHIDEHDSCIEELGKDNPVLIKSKIFSIGGLYQISLELKSIIDSTHSQVLGIKIPQKSVDLFITLGQNEKFEIQNVDQKILDTNLTHIKVRSYYDKINSFKYTEENQTQKFTFDMPFNWNQTFVNQIPFLHLELFVPKSTLFAKTNAYIGTLNGNILSTKSILIDDYSSDYYRIIHMVVNSDKLDQIIRQSFISQNQRMVSDQALFSLSTSKEIRFPLEIGSLKNKYLFQISWNPEKIYSGEQTTFIINIQDPKSGDLLRHTYFDFSILNSGTEIYKEHILTDFGALTKDIVFPFSQDNQFSILIDKINGEDDGIILNLSVS